MGILGEFSFRWDVYAPVWHSKHFYCLVLMIASDLQASTSYSSCYGGDLELKQLMTGLVEKQIMRRMWFWFSPQLLFKSLLCTRRDQQTAVVNKWL
ncbi:hypothetical protein ACOSQ3_000649 [Xanthoceras sorbifolium]